VSAVVGVIVNKPPEAHGFTLQPADVTAGTATLYVQVSTAAHDIDGDPVTVEYAWFKNDVDQGFPVAQTTVAGPFTPGDVWKVVATATDGQGGVTVSEQSEAVLFEADQVAMGFDFSCVSTTTGQLRCWGWNYSLQTGTNGGNVPTPVTLGWASAVSQVAAADYHACALLTSGAVKCWGDQYQGRLGNNVTFGPYIAEPQDVVGLGAGSGVVQISANYDHSCAVLNTGVVKCWGYNGTQQLGQSHSMQASGVPVSPSGITDAVSVTTGRYHSCAVRRNGKGVCWGYQYQGRLGNGSASNDYALNSEVAMSSNLASIAASDRHSCAVTTDGALYCWGYNYDGAVGVNQQYVEFSTPQQIFPSGVAAVATGDRYTCAAKTDGTVWCWGHNFDNAAGVSTYGTLLTPRQTSLTDVVRLDAGNRHNCAVLQTGSLRCWGSNISYALGDGSSDSNGSYLGVTPIGFVP
jgi:alpha-tubulin suppressor-like RCC1 family protein